MSESRAMAIVLIEAQADKLNPFAQTLNLFQPIQPLPGNYVRPHMLARLLLDDYSGIYFPTCDPYRYWGWWFEDQRAESQGVSNWPVIFLCRSRMLLDALEVFQQTYSQDSAIQLRQNQLEQIRLTLHRLEQYRVPYLIALMDEDVPLNILQTKLPASPIVVCNPYSKLSVKQTVLSLIDLLPQNEFIKFFKAKTQTLPTEERIIGSNHTIWIFIGGSEYLNNLELLETITQRSVQIPDLISKWDEETDHLQLNNGEITVNFLPLSSAIEFDAHMYGELYQVLHNGCLLLLTYPLISEGLKYRLKRDIEYISRNNIHTVILIKVDASMPFPHNEIRAEFQIPPEIPILPCDIHSTESIRNAMMILLDRVEQDAAVSHFRTIMERF